MQLENPEPVTQPILCAAPPPARVGTSVAAEGMKEARNDQSLQALEGPAP